MAREAYTIEYMIRSSPAILYNFLTTPSGLAQWFADTCDVTKGLYTFSWNGAEEQAELVENEENERVRFRWLEADDDEYFEFRIEKSEVANDTILYITDFAEDYDVEDQKMLWESQLKLLTQQIGG